jgi:predicted hydrocarbon binding protein
MGCACRYPESELKEIRKAYEETGDIDEAHQMLQERFEFLLRNVLGLSDELFEDVVGRGWGAAGIRRGNEIIATKIPKSGHLVEYLNATDTDERRQLYCHCPRVRDVLKASETLSPTYCYCGAGYYKGIWEEIVQRPVEVEVLESVLKGDEVCKVAIRLPLEP